MLNPFQSFRLRVSTAMVCSMVLLAIIGDIITIHYTFQTQFENQRAYLMNLAKNSALLIDAQALKQVPLNKEGINTSAYQSIAQELKRLKAANPQIEFIYLLTPTSDKKRWKFILDLDVNNPKGNKVKGSTPGTFYNAGRFDQMLKGLNNPSADLKIEEDEFGKTLSGYAPIRDEIGRPFAILGVDIDARNINTIQQELTKRALIILLIAILFAFVLGSLISGWVVRPVTALKSGVDHLKGGNWDHKVTIPGNDEIAQLADSFNEMALGLKNYRQLLQNHFYDSVQSLAILLDARDSYTLGHSQAVADYFERIALRMGIEPKLVEHFKKAVLLHDIGKVGVRDDVLLKTDKLDDLERNVIQKHPELGEKILKPILEDPLMLSIIRHHHERYDGKGYPDGLAKTQIPLIVSIVTVADSYDAMTSTRAYRKAMSKEEAIAQLLKNKNTQFHPQVVDAFVEILKES